MDLVGRRLFCLVCLGPGLAAGIRSVVAEENRRPNIIVLLMDDLRADALSCTGHPFVKTPNIDRIAIEGATFRNAFVTTPLCLPSRACFLTGQYAHTNRVQVRGTSDNFDLSYKLVTFPKLLQESGYETAFIGKWHIGDDDSPRPGFNRWVSFISQGKYVDPELNIDGKRTKVLGYITDILTDYAVNFINAPHQRPYLIYLCHKAVHAPFVPAARHTSLFSAMEIERAPSAQDTLVGKPVLRRPHIELQEDDPDVRSSDELIRNQLRCLMAADEGIGRIFEALGKNNQLENTVIVFSSDHGYFWGEHGLGGKHGAYEEALRIPLLLRFPKLLKPGTVFDQLVLNIDLAPTCLELAKARIPSDIQGASLVPVMLNNSQSVRSSFLAEYFYNQGQTPRFPTWQVVRTERWKYIHYPNVEDMDELYDLKSDRYEMQNLVDRSSSKNTLSELKTELKLLLKKTNYKP
jgi:arylsulfatase A-like enzyme